MLRSPRPLPPALTAITAAAIAAATAAAIGLSAMPAGAAGADPDDRAAPKPARGPVAAMLREFRRLEARTTSRENAPLHGSKTAAEGSVSGEARASSQGLPNSFDWTGFYLGGQVGLVSGDSDFGDSDEDAIGGVTGGYDHDFGKWVLGAGLDFDITDVSVTPNADLDHIFRVKSRLGYKFGRSLLYGSGGFAFADTNRLGSEGGFFVGGGYEYKLTQFFSVGGEVLYHDFGDFEGGTDIDVTTFQIRATYRF